MDGNNSIERNNKDQIDFKIKYPEIMILVAGILLLGLLLFSIQSIVTPFIIILSIIFLLYPLRKNKLVKIIMWLSVILFLLWVFFELINILFPFIIALLLAYLFNPLVKKLKTYTIPRWLTSLAILLFMLGVLIAGVIFVMPVAIQQFNGILFAITDITSSVAVQIKEGKLFEWLSKYGVPIEYSREILPQHFAPRLEGILTKIFETVLNFFSSISDIITQIINIIIIPFLTFYLLKDFPKITEKIASVIPPAEQEFIFNYLSNIDKLLGRYLRGALLVAFIHGFLIGFFLWIFGIIYPLVLGMVSGVLSLIPYFGLFISVTLAFIFALFSGDPVWLKIVFVFATFGFLLIMETSVISPNIMGRQIGLHPVVLILSLLVFGHFLGFIGLLIALPVSAIIIMTMKDWFERRKEKNKLMLDEAV